MRSHVATFRILPALALALPLCFAAGYASGQDAQATIERVKQSVVPIGTYERTRTPAFQFRGTAFVVGDGTFVVTNAHVLPGILDTTRLEVLGVLVPGPSADKVEFREAKQVAVDPGSDLAVLKIGGAALPGVANPQFGRHQGGTAGHVHRVSDRGGDRTLSRRPIAA